MLLCVGQERAYSKCRRVGIGSSSYASMTFNQSQRNYSTLDRELAALRWAVKTFRSFLYGIKFIIKTDHHPLVYLHMRLVDA